MPTQYPTLSTQEQIDRWSFMAKKNLYPYTYIMDGSFLASEFPRTNGSVSYLTIPWQADNNLAISNLEISFAGVPIRPVGQTSDSFGTVYFQVSYDSTLNVNTVTPALTPVVPTDSGNIIYNSVTDFKVDAYAGADVLYGNVVSVDAFHRFEPYNYLVKYNQIVYIHLGMAFNGAAQPNGAWWSSVIFHCLNTGLKV